MLKLNQRQVAAKHRARINVELIGGFKGFTHRRVAEEKLIGPAYQTHGAALGAIDSLSVPHHLKRVNRFVKGIMVIRVVRVAYNHFFIPGHHFDNQR